MLVKRNSEILKLHGRYGLSPTSWCYVVVALFEGSNVGCQEVWYLVLRSENLNFGHLIWNANGIYRPFEVSDSYPDQLSNLHVQLLRPLSAIPQTAC